MIAARLIALMLVAGTARAGEITVTAEPIGGFQKLSGNESFGPFTWRGGLELSSETPEFGGFSGLALSSDCSRLTAVSDAGRWLSAELRYEDGRLAGLAGAQLAPVLDSKGRPQRNKVWGDAEALTALGGGKFAVAFESRVRFGTYDLGRYGLEARFEAFRHPEAIDDGPDNGEVEALGVLPDGRFLAAAEQGAGADGRIKAWAWKGKKTVAFGLQQHSDYLVTDIAVLPDGQVLTLERSFSRTSLPGMAIRRFPAAAIADGAMIEPELLFEGRYAFYVIDNMEAIAVCERAGETRVTVMSDNNFNTSLQSTLLLQFAYTP